MHALFHLGAHLIADGCRRPNRQLIPVSGPCIVTTTTQSNAQQLPGQGYLPGYQQFQNPYDPRCVSSTVVMPPQPQVFTRPDNHLIMAILTTLFCFFPFGIVGWIYALKVDHQYDQGEFQQAMISSYYAKNWSVAALIAGCCTAFFIVLYFVLTNTADNV